MEVGEAKQLAQLPQHHGDRLVPARSTALEELRQQEVAAGV